MVLVHTDKHCLAHTLTEKVAVLLSTRLVSVLHSLLRLARLSWGVFAQHVTKRMTYSYAQAMVEHVQNLLAPDAC